MRPGNLPEVNLVTQNELLIQLLINGITVGSYLAIIALGYTMVYGIIELINFAHGDLYMLGFMVSLTVLTALNARPGTGGWELWAILIAVLLVTMLGTGLLNVTIDRIAYKPLRRAPRLAPLITAVGVSFMLENLALIWKGSSQILYPNLLPVIDIGNDILGLKTNVFFTTKDIVLIGVTVPLMIGLTLFIRNTKMGKAMRATAQDREAAALMGINAENVIRTTFFIGGSLAGAAGMIVGLYLNTGRYLMGFDAGLLAFTSAVLGGIGNVTGAMLGGYVIGFLEAYSDQYLSAEWTRILVFTILILVLMFRPAGLLGQRTTDKL
jgi:branched-chain amino acid transport system permease protein